MRGCRSEGARSRRVFSCASMAAIWRQRTTTARRAGLYHLGCLDGLHVRALVAAGPIPDPSVDARLLSLHVLLRGVRRAIERCVYLDLQAKQDALEPILRPGTGAATVRLELDPGCPDGPARRHSSNPIMMD